MGAIVKVQSMLSVWKGSVRKYQPCYMEDHAAAHVLSDPKHLPDGCAALAQGHPALPG